MSHAHVTHGYISSQSRIDPVPHFRYNYSYNNGRFPVPSVFARTIRIRIDRPLPRERIGRIYDRSKSPARGGSARSAGGGLCQFWNLAAESAQTARSDARGAGGQSRLGAGDDSEDRERLAQAEP